MSSNGGCPPCGARGWAVDDSARRAQGEAIDESSAIGAALRLAVDAAVGRRVASIPRGVNADPRDRIIVATAEVLGLDGRPDQSLPSMTENDPSSGRHRPSLAPVQADTSLGKVLLWYYYRRRRSGSDANRRTDRSFLLGMWNRRAPE